MFSFFDSLMFLCFLDLFFSISNVYGENSFVLIYKEFYCLFQKVSRFKLSFPTFSLVLLTTTHNESDIEISNVGGATHSCFLPILYLHKQSLKRPTHVNFPPPFKI